jgi:hypothetical protein
MVSVTSQLQNAVVLLTMLLWSLIAQKADNCQVINRNVNGGKKERYPWF